MQRILEFLTHLPLPLLYGLGRFAYFVAFHVLRWHRELAARNLANAFPEKSPEERARLLRQSFVNLGQTLAETFWGYGASAEALTKRVVIENVDLIERFVREGRPVVLLTAHVCNWEWLLPAAGARFGVPIDAVYKPLRVASLDAFIRETRSRFGGKPIPIQSFVFELMRRAGQPRAYAMVADQTPPRNMDKHWTRFLNQDTAFFTGADRIAKFLDAPVVYVAMRRTGKGHYSVRLHVLVEPPYEVSDELDVVERYARRLEAEIRSSPADWLWVHNKWKYPRPTATSERSTRTRRRVPSETTGR
ncbi:MAG TPA: lysophospholipid acyltransferase family protein [Casimicrobiaceae bacterium]|nr:lysophospholipid acyltransferase family protein [Casimicrobiaceae bacterium]